jgi:hypothetical protein
MNGYHCFNSSLDPEQPKNVKFLLWSIIATSRGGAYDVLGEVQKFSEEVLTSKSGYGKRIYNAHNYANVKIWKAENFCDIDTWDKRNGMLCSNEQLFMGRILDTKSSYKWDMQCSPKYFENQVPQTG